MWPDVQFQAIISTVKEEQLTRLDGELAEYRCDNQIKLRKL